MSRVTSLPKTDRGWVNPSWDGPLLAQNEKAEQPPVEIDIFSQPEAKPKKGAQPKQIQKTTPKPSPGPQPTGKETPIQEVMVADELYQEFLVLADTYREVSAALQAERGDREQLEERLATVEITLTNRADTLEKQLKEAKRKEAEARKRSIYFTGGVIAAVTAIAGTAVYLLRSHNQRLHAEYLRAMEALRNAWINSIQQVGQQAARKAVARFLRENRELVQWLAARDQRSAQWAGWREWMYANQPPVIVSRIRNLQEAFNQFVANARSSLPTVAAAASGMVYLKAGAIVFVKAAAVVAAGFVVGGAIHYSGLGRYIGIDEEAEKFGDWLGKKLPGPGRAIARWFNL